MSGRLTMDAILDVAERVADDIGLDRLTVSAVARELNVRPPSLYHHIAGQDRLLAALAVRGCVGVADALRRAAVGRSGADAIRTICRAHRRYALAHPSLYLAAMRAPRQDDEELRAANRELLDLVAGVLRAAGLSLPAARQGTRSLRAAVHGFICLELVDGFEPDLNRDRSYEQLISLLATGLLGTEPPSRARRR